MNIHFHSYVDDPAPTSLHGGWERLAIEAALTDARLERRGHLLRALVRHLPHRHA